MRAYIRGKPYTIEFTPLPKGTMGDCSDPNLPNRRIRINSNCNELTQFNTLVHEVLHACYWDMDEGAIREAELALSRILRKLGARIEVQE